MQEIVEDRKIPEIRIYKNLLLGKKKWNFNFTKKKVMGFENVNKIFASK